MKDDTSSTLHAKNRRLAAIMFTDIVGFSRQMGSNEARTLQLLDTHNQLIQQVVNDHHGKVIKTVGDAFLVDFPSAVNAVQVAQQIQARLRTYNAEKGPAEQIHVRIGIHLGDIVQSVTSCKRMGMCSGMASISPLASRRWLSPTPFASRTSSIAMSERSWIWARLFLWG